MDRFSVLLGGRHQIELPLWEKRTSVILKDALYATSISFIIILTNRIASTGLAVLFEGKMCQILSKGPKREVIAEILQLEGLYSVLSQNASCPYRKGETYLG